MKKKNWKRFLAGVLCVAMMASMLPASAVEEIGEDVGEAIETVTETLGDILPSADPEATPETTEAPESVSTPDATPEPTEEDGDIEVLGQITIESGSVSIDENTGNPTGTITFNGLSANEVGKDIQNAIKIIFYINGIINKNVSGTNMDVNDEDMFGTNHATQTYGFDTASTEAAEEANMTKGISNGYVYIRERYPANNTNKLTIELSDQTFKGPLVGKLSKAGIAEYCGVDPSTITGQLKINYVAFLGMDSSAKGTGGPIPDTLSGVKVPAELAGSADPLDMYGEGESPVTKNLPVTVSNIIPNSKAILQSAVVIDPSTGANFGTVVPALGGEIMGTEITTTDIVLNVPVENYSFDPDASENAPDWTGTLKIGYLDGTGNTEVLYTTVPLLATANAYNTYLKADPERLDFEQAGSKNFDLVATALTEYSENAYVVSIAGCDGFSTNFNAIVEAKRTMSGGDRLPITVTADGNAENGTLVVTYKPYYDGTATRTIEVPVTCKVDHPVEKYALTVYTGVDLPPAVLDILESDSDLSDAGYARKNITSVKIQKEGSSDKINVDPTGTGVYSVDVASGKYTVYLNDYDCGKVEITTAAATVKKILYTVEVRASGGNPDKLGVYSGDTYVANQKSLVVPMGTTLNIEASEIADKDFTWVATSEGATKYAPLGENENTKLKTTVTLDESVSGFSDYYPEGASFVYTATYTDKPAYDFTFNINLDGNPWSKNDTSVTLLNSDFNEAGTGIVENGAVTFQDLAAGEYAIQVADTVVSDDTVMENLYTVDATHSTATLDFYTVTVKSGNTSLGTVNVPTDGTAAEDGNGFTAILLKGDTGTTLSSTPTAKANCTFVNWTKGGTEVTDGVNNTTKALTVSAPTATATYIANFAANTFEYTVNLKLNNDALTEANKGKLTVKMVNKADSSEVTATTDGVAAKTYALTQGSTYAVYVNGYLIADNIGAAGNVTAEFQEVSLKTDGKDTSNTATITGPAPATGDAPTQTANSATAKTIVAPVGQDVTLTNSAATNYEFRSWYGVSATAVAGGTSWTYTVVAANAATEITANFTRNTSDVTLNFKNVPVSGGASTDHTLTNATVLLDSQTDSASDITLSNVSGASAKANAEHGVTYKVLVDNADTGVTVTITDADDSDKTKTVNWYEVALAPTGDSAHGFVDQATTAFSKQPEDTAHTSAYYLPGSTVYVAAKPATNYKMADTNSWSKTGDVGTLAIDDTNSWKATYTTGAGAVTLTASFVLASHSQKVIVKINDEVQKDLKVTMTATGITAVEETTGTDGSVTFNGLTNDKDYTFTVTDPAADPKVFVGATATRAKADVTGATEALDDITISLWSVTFNTDNKDTKNTVTAASVVADSSTPKTVYYKEGETVTVTAATTADNFRFDKWSTASGLPTGTDTSTATVTYTVPTTDAEAVTLTAAFQEMYQVTAKKPENGTYAAAVGSVEANFDTTKDDGDAKWVDVGSYVKLYTPEADEGYRFKEWSITGTGDLKKEAAGTTDAATTEKEVYFFPTATGATVNATFEKDEFTATVNLKDSKDAALTEKQVVEIYKKTDSGAGDLVATSGTATDPVKELTFNSAAGSYSVTGLPSGEGTTEYVVKVNGYLVDGTTIQDADGKRSADITMYKITVKGRLKGNDGNESDIAASTDNTTFTVKGVVGTASASVYVPAGAAAGSTVTLAASAQKNENEANNHYRVATDSNGDKPLWTLSDDTATTGISGTAYTITGIAEDTELHAHFVQMHKVTATPISGQGDATWVTDITVGETPTSGATAFKLVDAGTRVKLDVTPTTTKRLKGWEAVTGVEYYATGVSSDTTELKADATTGRIKVENTNALYVLVTADTTIHVEMEDDVFTGTITVKYGDAVMDAVKVEIKKGNTTVADETGALSNVDKLGHTVGTGVYTYGELANGTEYSVSVNGYPTGQTLKTENANVTVNLIKVSVAVNVDGIAGGNNNFHKAELWGGAYSRGTTDIYVLKSVACDVNIQGTPGSDTTNDVVYRMRTVAKDGTDNTFWTKTEAGGTAASVAGSDKTDAVTVEVNSEKDVTFTANYVSQYTVTVAKTVGNDVGSVKIGASGTSATVDHGDTATVTATPANKAASGMKDYAFDNWTAENGSGMWDTTDNADKATAKFTPSKSTTLTAHFRNLQATNATGTDVTWSDTTGVTWTVTAGYTPTDHSAVITLGNVGDVDTKALTASLTDTDSAFGTVTGITDGTTTITKTNGTLQITVPINLMAHKTEDGSDPSTYTANLTIKEGDAEGDMSITIPLTLKVNKSATFTAVVHTYEDYEGTNYDPDQTSADGIDSGKLVVKPENSTASAAGIAPTSGSNGKYSFAGLDSAKTYEVWVNGYNTKVKITDANYQTGDADTPFNVPLVTVKWSAETYTEGAVTLTAADTSVQRTSGTGTTGGTKPLSVPKDASVSVSHTQTTDQSGKWSLKHYSTKQGETTGNTTTAVTSYNVTTATILAPVYDKMFKVEIADGKYEKNASETVSLTTKTVTVGGATIDNSAIVTGTGTTVPVAVSCASPEYVFKTWEVSDSKGAMSAEAVNANFIPDDAKINAGDTITLTPVFYKVAELKIDKTTYSKTEDTGDVVLTFTPNSGTNFTKITMATGDLSEVTDKVERKDETDGVIKYTLKEAWLKEQKVTTGDGLAFTAHYTLGTDSTATTNTVNLTITANKKDLTKAEIGVKLADEDNGTRVGTANVDHTNHKIVEKVSYTDAAIDPNELTWAWYYADSAPTEAETKSGTLPTGATQIAGETGTSVTVPTAAKGKYVFAKVTVKANAETATAGDTVLSNAIPVDYDASVVVKVDNSVIGDATTANKYKVVLKPAVGTDVTLTFDDTNDKYVTNGSSQLTGGVEYDVYVSRSTTEEANTDSQKDITPADFTVDGNDAIQYWSVKKADFTVENAVDSNNVEVGETFDNTNTPAVGKVTITATKTDTTPVTVADGDAVLDGTAVTVTATTWTQDYKLTWKNGSAETDTVQDSDTASGTGYEVTPNAATTIGGVLNQNTYKIVGDIKATGGAKVAAAKLELTADGKTYTFNGNVKDGGTDGKTVEFTLPKTGRDGSTLSAGLTLSATGVDSPKTTILGYDTSATASTATTPEENPAPVAVTDDKASGAFRIFAEVSTWQLKVEDDDASNKHSAESKLTNTDSDNNKSVTHTDTVELDYTGADKVVTLTNTGNTTLSVTLADPNLGNDSKFTVKEVTGSSEIAVTYANAFTLAPGATKQYKVSYAAGLDYDADNYIVPLAFTSKQVGADGSATETAGPAVTFNLKVEVKQAVITKGEITESGGKYTASVTEYKNSSKSEIGGSGGAYGYTLKNDDVTYAWAVTENTSNAPTAWTDGTGATYTPKADGSDAGKYLWVKITGQNNATGEVVSDTADSAVLGPQEIPYSLQVKINQDGVQYTDTDPSTDKYKVEVVADDDANVKGDVAWDDTNHVFNVTGLLPSYTYTLKASGVEGETTHLVDFKKNIGTDKKGDTIVVDYYSVTYGNTSVTNAYTGMDANGILAAGSKVNETYKINSAIRTIGSTNVNVVNGNHVLTGSQVKFNTPAWTAYDYTRSWDRDAVMGGDTGVTGTETQADNTSTYDLTYNKVLGEVTAHLTQKTYTVTAHVNGGTATELTMTNGKNIFTTAANASADSDGKIKFNAVGAVKPNVGDGAEVSFTVPKGTYALEHVLPKGSQVKEDTTGYLVPYVAGATEGDQKAEIEVSANGSYGLYLESEGYTLKIADDIAADAGTHTGQSSSSTNNLTGAELNESAGVYEVGVTRSYGWTTSAADTITLTLSNGNKSKLHAVKLDDSSTVGDTGAFTLTEGSFASNATVDLDVFGSDNSITLKLNPETGTVGSETPLKVGTYTATLVFNFKTSAEGEYSVRTTLTYKLTLKVEPNALASVKLIDIGKGSDQSTEVNDSYHDVPSDTNLKAGEIKDSENNVIDPADVDYKWYRVPQGTTGVTEDNIKEKGTEVTPGSGKDTYPVVPADQGQDIYLLVVAKDDGSTSGSVLSHVANVKWTGKVFIHTDDAAVPADGNGDPSYGTIKFVDGSTEIAAAWNTTDKAYESADLIAGTTYTVKVPEFKDSTNTTLVAAGTVDSSDLTKKSNEKTVDYYTINYSDVTTATEFKTGTGADFTANNTDTNNFTASGLPKLAAALGTTIGGTALADKTPVLKGQDVTVYTKAAWSQDYNAFWTVNDTADTTGQTPSASHSDGKTVSNISAKTTVTAALKQNTYTVTGTITGGVGTDLSLITLVKDDVTFTTGADDTGSGKKVYNAATLGGTNSVKFEVPKGTYTITATPKTGKSVISMEAAGVTGAQKGNTITLAEVPATAGGEARLTFKVNLEDATDGLTVKDDNSTSATSSLGDTTNNKVAEYAEPDVYFAYANGIDTVISLANQGNSPLTVKVKVEEIKGTNDTGTAKTLYDSAAPAAWADADTANGTGTKVTLESFGLDATTTTYTLAPKNDAGTDDEVTVGTLKVPIGLKNNQDVWYKFTFTSTDATTGATGPTVTYIYKLVIEPLTLASVTAEGHDGTKVITNVGVGNTARLKDASIANIGVTDGTNTSDAQTKGLKAWATGSGDFKYQWFTADTNDVTDTDFDFNSYTPTAKVGSAAKKIAAATGTGKDGNAYTAVEADMGKYLYLVVYASGEDANAESFAVSGPVATQFLPKVKVAVDGTALAGTTDPGYTLYLAENSVSDTTGLTALTWDADTDSYRPKNGSTFTSIDPDKTYNVWAQDAKGAGATQIKTDVQFKPGGTYTDNTVTVDYYTVNFEKAIQVSNTSDAVSSALAKTFTEGVTAKVGEVALTTGDPVLKDQQVTFTMTANQDNTETTAQSWDDTAHKAHYTAGWTGAGITADNGIAYPDSGTLTKEVTVSAAGTAGTSAAPVTATLTQKLYTVKFTVVDEKGSATNANLTGATLTVGSDTITGTLGAQGKHDDVVTFTGVPAHDKYTLTATPGATTKLVKYTVSNVDDAEPADGATVKVAADAPANAGETYSITIAEKAYKLEWQIADGSNWKTATENSITDLLYNYNADTATDNEYELRLVNSGNEKLTGVKVGTAPKTGTNQTDTTKLSADFPVGGAGNTLTVTIYNKDNSEFKPNQDLTNPNGVEIPAGGYAKIPAMKIHAGGTPTPATVGFHAMDLSATSTQTGTAIDKAVVFAASYEIAPATITKTAVTDLDTPVKGQTPDTSATLSDVLANSPETDADASDAAIQTTSVTWTKADGSPFTGNFDAGTSYKVTVVLTAATGYKFDGSYLDKYTILGIPGVTGATVTGTVTGTGAGNTLTLTYTFPATAAGNLTVQAKALNQNQGQVTKLEVPTTVAQDFYYVVTTTETLGEDQQVKIATAPTSITGHKGHGTAPNIVVTGDKATATPNETISSLDSGTKYYVHAIAVNADTATDDITNDNLAYGSTWFKTHYQVTVKVKAAGDGEDQTARGDVLVGTDANTYKTKTVYVKAEAPDYTNPGSTVGAETLDINAKPIDTWLFDTWTISEATAGTADGTLAGNATTASNTFTPSHNATLTATFKAQPVLEFNDGSATHGDAGKTGGDGNMVIRSNQITTGYPANLTVVNDGKLANTGSGKLSQAVVFKITSTSVNAADVVSATGVSYFTLKGDTVVPADSGKDLKAGAYIPLSISPAQGLDNLGKFNNADVTDITVKKTGSGDAAVAEYTVRIWAYDPGNVDESGAPTVYDYFDMTLGVCSENTFAPNPLNPGNWDLNDHDSKYVLNDGSNNSVNPKTQVPDGKVEVTINGFAYTGAETGTTESDKTNNNDFIALVHFKGQGKDVDLGGYTAASGSSRSTGGIQLTQNTDFTYASAGGENKVYNLELKADGYLPKFVTGTAKNDIDALFGAGKTYVPQAGDAFTIRIRLHNDSKVTQEKFITLTFTDTTPTVDKASAALSTAAGGDQTVTTTVTLKANGGGGTGIAGQPDYDSKELLVNWYTTTDKSNTTPDTTGVTLIQGPGATAADNKLTYAVQPEDAGKYIFAIVTGDVTAYPDEIHGGAAGAAKVGHNYAGSATTTPIYIASEVTAQAGKINASNVFEPDTDYGTVTPTTGSVTETGDKFIEFTAAPKTGYVFVQWQLKDGDEGHFGEGTDVTSTTAKVKFYPEGKPTIQAVFAKLPELGIEAENTSPASTAVKNYTYDYGAGASSGENTAPELYYVKNDGSGKVSVIIAPDTRVAGNTASFKTSGTWATAAGGEVHTIDISSGTNDTWQPAATTLKANLNPGTYTITYKDTEKGATATDGKADYDVQVTLTIKNTQKALPAVTISKVSDSTAVTTAAVGDEVKAYFAGNSGQDDVDVSGNTPYDADKDNATYIWYYGPAGKDPTANTTGLTKLKADDGSDITTKSFEITDKMIDQLRTTTGNVLYVLATAKPNTDYTGKAKDDTTYTNPEYVVKLVVKSDDGVTFHGTVTASDGSAVTDTSTAGQNFTVQRGSYVTLNAQVTDPGYQFDHWEITSSGTDPVVYDGAFGSFTGSTDNLTTQSGGAFYPHKGDSTTPATVTAVFRPIPKYAVTVTDNDTAPGITEENFGILYVGGTVDPAVTKTVTIGNPQDAQKVTATVSGDTSAFTVTFTSGNTDFTSGGKSMNANSTVAPAFTVTPKVPSGATAGTTYTVTITVQGDQSKSSDPANTAIYTATYTVSAVGTKDIDKPTNGGSPDFTATVLDDPRFDIQKDSDNHDVTWKKVGDTNPMKDGDKFEPGDYTASVTIKFEDGTQFSNVDIIENYAPTFNGEAATTGGPVTVERNTDGTITITRKYTVTANTPSPGPSGPSGPVVPEGCFPVYYWIGLTGQTSDPTIETVEEGKTPASVPTVTALEGYKFLGWTDSDPAKLKEGQQPKLVDPTKVKITKDTTFYAVYETDEGHTIIEHTHYVIGYPNGTFGPADAITRGSVATIIARACLEGFVEGADYGNPGGYSDVTHDWAYSAISFCTMHGVFKGYDDGTFRPGQPITRQEFATVIARLAGMKANQGTPFSDEGDVAGWAKDGVYTAYVNGWVNGYTDGTFKPLNNIRRDEAVKIFNGYLNRGVDAQGLSGLKEYVHTGVASNNTEDGHDEYMTWPDVNKSHWAYYEIIEAANDHAFYYKDETEKKPPETWDSVKIDERWRYHDDAADGGPQA